jgi:hypothetical protein
MTSLRIQIEIDSEISPELYAVLLPLKRVKRTEKLRALAVESLSLKKLQLMVAQGLVPLGISDLQEGIARNLVNLQSGTGEGGGEGAQKVHAAPAVIAAPAPAPALNSQAPKPESGRQVSRGRALASSMSQSLLRG